MRRAVGAEYDIVACTDAFIECVRTSAEPGNAQARKRGRTLDHMAAREVIN